MSSDLQGKHVVITGGTGALGRAVVARLLELGAVCHLPCVEDEVPPGLTLRDHERVRLTCGVDLSHEPAVIAYYKGLESLWASVHLAGGFAMAPIEDTDLAAFRRMFALNAITCFLCSREAVRVIRRSRVGGRLVNVAARPALEPAAGMIAYSTAKAAVAAMTRSLAEELRDERILVNAVVPSTIDTPANRDAMPTARYDRWPKPAQLAEAISYLVSPRNELTSGALVPVYGRG
jgi:NAD(P)-dependent dehydrogenase (short-subunit alcohol dehydrogenase family)